MSTIAIIVLATVSVANSLKITSIQQPAAADHQDHRDKNQQIQHTTAEDESRSLKGKKGWFDCSDLWFEIELNNKEIAKYKTHSDLAQSLRQTSEKEAGLPQRANQFHAEGPKPEDDYYWNYQHLHLLTNELNKGIGDLKTYLAIEQGNPSDPFCFGKNKVIRRQGQVISKYVAILDFTLKFIGSLQRKVIFRQSRLIEKRKAMLSAIEAKEEQLDIQPQRSGEEQAVLEMALRSLLSKDIEALDTAIIVLDNYAPSDNENCARRKKVTDYQKGVIGRYEKLLVVSFTRLKERFEPNAEIKHMQAALENLLKADIKKMKISMNLLTPTSMPTSMKLLKPVPSRLNA